MVDISPSPSPPKRASSPTGLDVPTNGQLGGSTVTQSSSSNPATPRSSSTTAANLMELIDPLLRTITTYLPQPDLMNASRTSKRMNTLIPRATTYEQRAPGTIVTVLHLRPAPDNRGESVGRGRLQQLVQQLQQLHDPDDSNSVLQRYQHAMMTDWHKFTLKPRHDVRGQYLDLVKKIKRTGPRIEGITSLNFCFSSPYTPVSAYRTRTGEKIYGLITLPYLLPSLREVDFTNTVADSEIAQIFFKNCPHLEKITFNSEIGILTRGGRGELVTLPTTLTNLKELNLDEANFFKTSFTLAMWDLVARTEEEVFRFHQFRRTVLERVSMRKATYARTAIPQTVLLKLIRHAPPTLRWFRSDLTPDNITIAHDERPDIEFVS